jgi:hypothetical protein
MPRVHHHQYLILIQKLLILIAAVILQQMMVATALRQVVIRVLIRGVNLVAEKLLMQENGSRMARYV